MQYAFQSTGENNNSNTQLSFFQENIPYNRKTINTAISETISSTGKVVRFPGTIDPTSSAGDIPPRKTNYHKGEEQTVFPIKSRKQLEDIAAWLKENADRKYLLAFILGINLGLRVNELLELKRSDVFFPDGRIRYIVGDCTDTTDRISVFQDKVDKRRGLYLNESCVHAIEWYYGDKRYYNDDYIFASREGGHIEVDTLRKILKKAAKACGVKQNIGTHTLRKTFGYFHYMSNHDVVFLQRLFGHSSALITMRYIGIADEEEKKAYHSVSIDLL